MEEKRILAIDFGSKRIGIAITDPMNIFAYPLTTLSNDSNIFKNIKGLIEQYNVVKVLIGLPLKESGEDSVTSKSVYKFKDQFAKQIQIEIEYVDERFSSSIAKERVLESVSSKKKRRDKGLIDKNAAAVILEDYLKSL